MIHLEIHDSLGLDTKLWRYMDLAKFMSILQMKSIWLARADTFKDRQEGLFPDQMREWIAEAYKKLGDQDRKRVSGVEDFQLVLSKNTFVSCWHMSDEESMVMWEIYGRSLDAVAVQTTVENIKKSSAIWDPHGHSLLLRPVTYANAANVPGLLPYEECIFRKRPHFDFEKEVRLSLDTYDSQNPRKTTPTGYSLPVCLNILIEKVLVHPDSDEWFFTLIEGIVKRYGMHARVERGVVGNK